LSSSPRPPAQAITVTSTTLEGPARTRAFRQFQYPTPPSVRRALLTGYDKFTPSRFEWMQALLAVGDPDSEVAAAFVAKELGSRRVLRHRRGSCSAADDRFLRVLR